MTDAHDMTFHMKRAAVSAEWLDNDIYPGAPHARLRKFSKG
jgi:hypothetical protein